MSGELTVPMSTTSCASLLRIFAGPVVVIAIGLTVEQSGAFPLLRLALQRPQDSLPSSLVVPIDPVLKGHAVMSVFADDKDLYDRDTGLLTHTTGRGRSWERPATLSYFEGGTLRYASGVGLRIHGGSSRTGSPVQSFRVYFRRDYGATAFTPGIVFGPKSDPLRQMVIHNDLRRHGDRYWRLVNPLAYDIARQIGAVTVDTKPVRFYLNGKPQGVYVLSEHLTANYFRSHFGHGDFFPPDAEAHHLWRQLNSHRPLTMAAVSSLLDLENMTRWFLSVLLCDTNDAFQAPNQFRDQRTRDAKWFWINWDMDNSFLDWKRDTFQFVLERVGEPRRGRSFSEPRSYVFTTLLTEDAEYRAYFARLFDEMLNHRVTREFLIKRLRYYRQIATDYELKDPQFLDRVGEYLDRRPAFLRQLAEEYLNTEPSQRVVVSNPSRQPLLIDGFRVNTNYEGLYLPGNALTLDVPGESRARFAGWVIGDQTLPATQTTLSTPIRSAVTVEAKFR